MSRKRETHAQETCRLLAAGRYTTTGGTTVALPRPSSRGTVHRVEPALASAGADGWLCGALPAPAVVRVAKATSFEAAAQLKRDGGGSVAVLDFASDSEPGGGWRGRQQGTQ
eukprot:SAG31_NODE_27797_length_420_cov_0.647975_1_plen_111_part_10